MRDTGVTSPTSTFEMPRAERVLQGPGCLAALGEELDARGLHQAMVITGSSVGSSDAFATLLESLGDRVAGVFTGVKAHNPVEVVLQLIEQSRAARADSYIGVGGGSALDSAKWAALGAAEGIADADRLVSYEVHFEYPDKEWLTPLSAIPKPVVAIPTTLSAAEWDGFFSATNLQTGVKHVARYLELTPRLVLLDPEVSAATPRALWAQTGVRAVDHAVETAYARNAHPFTTSLAFGALELLARNLPASVADASDYRTALACQIAAWMSIAGVHNVSLGLSHAIGHQLGGLGVPHGVTSCIMLPHVMRFLEPATRSEQARMAEILRAARGGTEGSAAGQIEQLLDALGVPRRISEFDIPQSRLDDVAAATMVDVVARESPVPLTHEIVVDLLLRAW